MPASSTILLVDDEDSVQKLLTYPLERDGFQFYRRSPTLGRFVCRFDLEDAEADALVAALRRHCAAPARAAE